MFNIMLDALPCTFEGCPVNTDFRTAIQAVQLFADKGVGQWEKIEKLCELLFPGIIPVNVNGAVEWLLNGWYTDNDMETKGETKVLRDFDVDQWRIYSAFLHQYGMDLNTVDLHYWVFMGLLSNLDNCVFTEVMNIRAMKLDKNITGEARKALIREKAKYSLEKTAKKVKETEETDIKKQEAIDVFRSFRK